MTPREFDPVLSAALRQELQRRVDATSGPASGSAASRHPRRQAVIAIAVAAVLIALTVGTLRLTASAPSPATTGRTAATGGGIVDPLSELTDPSDDRALADGTYAVLLASRAAGARSFSFEVPPDVTSVRVYLACAPASTFRVTVARAFSGGCASRFQDFADIPTRSGTRTVRVTVPGSTRYSLLVVTTPDPDGTTTYSTLTVSPLPPAALPYPEVDPAALVGRKRGISAIRVTGRLDRAVDSLRMIVTCQGGGGLAVTTSDGSAFGAGAPSQLCAPDHLERTETRIAAQDGLSRYGRLRFDIRPYGDVSWTVTFLDGGAVSPGP